MQDGYKNYQEYKKRSNWHFDNFKPAEPGKDSFTHVCRFIADWTDIITECNLKASARYGANPKLQGSATQIENFYATTKVENDLFNKVADYLGIDNNNIKIHYHNQKTGQMTVEHIDNFLMLRVSNGDTDLSVKPDDTNSMKRFAIMLADWQRGQVFMVGNGFFHQWRAGDCITWEGFDMPHSTCNMGWEDRPMLQITGYTTSRTKEVLANASKDLIVDI
jgi:hypothetical protein